MIPFAPLSDVAEFIRDGTHGSPPRTEIGIPVLSAMNVKEGILNFETDRYTSAEEFEAFRKRLPLRGGDVLLTIVGTIGRAAVVEKVLPLVFQRSVAVIRPKQTVLDSRFLYHATQSMGFQNQLDRAANKSSQAGVYLGKLGEVKVPLPSLPEQRRIAAILDQADALRAKRREALAQLDELQRAIFIEMFGDLTINPKGFPVSCLGDICDVRDGTHDSPKFLSDGYPLVTTRNLRNGAIDFSAVSLISEEDYIAINKRSKVDRGDILMPMIGTIGNPILVDIEPNFAIKNMALVKFSKTSPEREFILNFLKSDCFEKLVAQKHKGGTQKFLALGEIRSLPVPVPDSAFQKQFVTLKDALSQQISIHGASLAELDSLFASLQYRAFRGEL